MDKGTIKETIIKTIEKHLIDSLDCELNNGMDLNKILADYSANSLDIVEIVSSTMRELRIKIPRTELSDIANISGLVDKFLHYADK